MDSQNVMTMHNRSILFQIAAISLLWFVFFSYIYFDPSSRLEPKLGIATFVAIPAAVIGISQLFISSKLQRASYVRDYALRFRTDKELTESFHFLVYRFGNKLFDIHSKSAADRTKDEQDMLAAAQVGVAPDLQFFDPSKAINAPQERRLDNLLGFFETLGYDLDRGMIPIDDISGMFGFYLDHIIQRKVIVAYLGHVEKVWPKAESFHEIYGAQTPFTYVRKLIYRYQALRIKNAPGKK